jgi:UDP-N-acetylmuramoyl-tripeptide--D-alanyl-D-alanine ligase
MKIELKKILSLIDGKVFHDKKIDNRFILKICTDTRKLKEGDCFLALKGENFNGNDFVEKAEELGASVIFIDEISKNVNLKNFSSIVILVKDCLKAYAKIANFYRNSLKAKIIGITGSVGKTTTKNLLGHCLNFISNGKAFASEANLNNQVGVPQNLFLIDRDHQYGVIEMGMQTKWEIDFLTKTAEPDIAIINNISAAHLEYFEDLKGIAEAKSEIFHGLKKDGFIILNKNTNHFEFLYEKAKQYSQNIILYSINFSEENCDVKMKQYQINEDNSADIEIIINNQVINYKLPFGIISLIENSLVIFSVFKALNLNYQDGVKALENFSIENLKGRGQILKKEFNGKNLIIFDETYNSGVYAMKASIKNLIFLPFNNEKINRRVAILGEMRELGDQAKKIHCDLIDCLNEVDFIITIGGENIKVLNNLIEGKKNGSHFENVDQILNHIDDLLQDGDLILIKGARGNYLEKILNYIDFKN